jgi:hypothetical protein
MSARPRRKLSSPNTLTLGNENSVDVYARAIANGWDKVSPLSVIVTGDIGSNSTATPALLFSGSYPDVTLTINAGVYVCGRGGLGGAVGQAGQVGGNAIQTTGKIKIDNKGVIGAGGGGGAGNWTNSYSASGVTYGGDGAGLPVLVPRTGAATPSATKTNGGTGTRGYSSGGGGYVNGGVGGAPGSVGGTGPSGGGGGLGGNGAASQGVGPGTTFTDPGGNGQNGPGTTDSDPTYNDYGSWAGGVSGKSIVGIANVTYVTQGTIYGPTS